MIIQGYDLEHPVLKILMGEESKEDFINNELELRQALHYPPFSRFVRYRFEANDVDLLKIKVNRMMDALRLELGKVAEERLMGPSEALLFRANQFYRFDVYYKAATLDELFSVSRRVKKMALIEEIDLTVDVDPYSS